MKFTLLWSVLAVELCHVQYSDAFSLSRSARVAAPRAGPLNYRTLDQDDVAVDNTAIRGVQVRTPVGFDLEDSLKKHEEQIQDVAEKKANGDDKESKSEEALPKAPKVRARSTAMNGILLNALTLNQSLILGLGTTFTGLSLTLTGGLPTLFQYPAALDWSAGVSAVGSNNPFLVGLVAVLPLLAFNKLVEDSDSRNLTNLNFSTITMVLTLFGRRNVAPDTFLPKPLQGKADVIPTTNNVQALLQSIRLGIVTGIAEETVFRYQIPGLVHYFFNTGNAFLLPLAVSSIIFAMGHLQPNTNKLSENASVFSLQLINGLWFGMIYVACGGNLAPAIVAHALYDAFVLFETWYSSNNQIEYAEKMALNTDEDREAARKIDPKLLPTLTRLFYTFDYDKNKSLSKSEVRKGFSYLALERAGEPPSQEKIDALYDQYTADKGRLSLSDFYDMYANSVQGSSGGGSGKSQAESPLAPVAQLFRK